VTQHSKPDPPGSLSFMNMYSSVGERLLGHYEIGESLGRGGVSEVYKARDTRLGRWVALKFLQSWAMGNPGLKERLLREAKCASILNHPNIVTLYDIAEANGVIFIVMEYVRGETLACLIPPTGLPTERSLDYALQTADALAAAEAAGILHGDLKPPNIMVTDVGRVKLLDFGLAWAMVSESKKEDNPPAMGTTVYMAPERLRDRELPPTPPSEIFSFGLILHQLLSGGHAFDEDSRQGVLDAIQSKSARELPGEVPEALAKIVDRCLEKLPERRFQSMRDLVRALEESSGAMKHGSARLFPQPSPPTQRQPPELDEVRALMGRITYANVPQSRKALKELARLIQGSGTPATREAATSGLSDMILTHEAASNGVPPTVRQVRRMTLDVLKLATQGELGSCFGDGELEGLDLFGMDFSTAQLTRVSFKGCFLVAADFEGACLRGASFKGAWIRNVDFTNADLAEADLTDADWFNTAGLTESQLASVRKGTLLECPPDVEALHRRLGVRYGYAFDSFDTDIQAQLLDTWNEYLLPGGLRDIVAARRRTTS
jgi:serine/threonine protein kinase